MKRALAMVVNGEAREALVVEAIKAMQTLARGEPQEAVRPLGDSVDGGARI